MNPVLILTHNCLELTKKCVESVRQQDVPTSFFIFDNGSTDGTSEWISAEGFTGMLHPENEGVSAGWNVGLEFLFEDGVTNHVLVVNNDTVLPPWFYRELLSYEVPFVTGTSVNTMEQIAAPKSRKELVESPDFSAFVIRREAWEKVGPFDERMKHYASDNDWHIRAHRAGIRLWNAGIAFYHERSSTLKNASPKDKRQIELQSDADSEVFHSIYGCYTSEPAYANLFK